MSITTQIAHDLKTRLRSGQQLPAELTLDALAQHYEVSFTPVRAALAELVAEGLLLRGSNRRLAPAPGAHLATKPRSNGQRGKRVSVETPPDPPRDLLKLVEHDLVELSLRGEEVHVREEAIAQQYAVSRSAMRNILNRLAGLGLLTHIPRRGWRVRPFRQEDLEAFLDVRELLELKALDLARDRLEPDMIQSILDRNQLPASPGEPPANDNSLHAYIIERAGNPYISDFFERHGRYYSILFHWEDQNEAAATQAVEQHRQILSAILRKDWESARSLLAWHIRSNHPVLHKIAGRDP